MRCIYCNAEMPDGAKFCGVCGERQEETQVLTRTARHYCIGCGEELTPSGVFCTYCGTKNDVYRDGVVAEYVTDDYSNGGMVEYSTYNEYPIGSRVEYNTYDEYPEEVKAVFRQYGRSIPARISDWVACIIAIAFLVLPMLVMN